MIDGEGLDFPAFLTVNGSRLSAHASEDPTGGGVNSNELTSPQTRVEVTMAGTIDP